MALKPVIQFPIFAPPNQPHHRHPATEVRFSRWNNANAEKFIRHERTQKEIEDQLRFHKRFDSAQKIANIHDNATTTGTETTFKSTGTPSTPSRPSIPGKKSKYSKTPQNPKNPRAPHPAFRPIVRLREIPNEAEEAEAGVKIGDNGVSYVIPEAPFEFQYSYTETPKEKPLKLREPPIAPFGPSTMPRPWTGRKPLPPSKKKLDFDSFRLPPPHKKGVKPVQKPGPFLPGSGPKYVKSREEILGEPLTKEEIDELVRGSMKARRQLNMGRDGLTHNMLDNIHALWKRRRVCKIKCKGVCTVDMENVQQQLEEKTGGKIIYSKGGVLYLFRGRNFNYKTRPHFPLMLWRPVTPVYPRLIQRAPEGLTLEEASEMRKKGRKLMPICKLGKNGVYSNLVNNVREAFEACELVRINCEGMNPSDYRKIGAKLKDLVPCVLISFEHEHILMWRGRGWKSSLPKVEDDPEEVKRYDTDGLASIAPPLDGQALSALCFPNLLVKDANPGNFNTSISLLGSEDLSVEKNKDLSNEECEDLLSVVNDLPSLASHALSPMSIDENESAPSYLGCTGDDSEALNKSLGSETILDGTGIDEDDTEGIDEDDTVASEAMLGTIGGTDNQSERVPLTCSKQQDVSENLNNVSDMVSLSSPWMQGVVLLWKQAVEGGSAVVLDDSCLDADVIYARAVALAQSAPPGPVFRRRPKKVAVQNCEKQETRDSEVKVATVSEVKEVVTVSERRGSERNSSRNRKTKDFNEDYLNVVPQGSLRIDELAKLLA